MKQLIALFVGINASCDEPNKNTGEYSFYGDVIVFGTKKERENYIAKIPKEGRLIVKGGKAKMREYCLGMTMYSFNEYLDGVISDCSIKRL